LLLPAAASSNITLITAIIGAVCGVLGAVLGIINTMNQLNRNKVRLRVTPKIAYGFNPGAFITSDQGIALHKLIVEDEPFRLCVEVVNLSAFAVTIHDIGFGTGREKRLSIVKPNIHPSGKPWPVRLEPHEAVTAYPAEKQLPYDATILRCAMAYAITDCGTIAQGSSPAFKEYVKLLLAQQHGGTKDASNV